MGITLMVVPFFLQFFYWYGNLANYMSEQDSIKPFSQKIVTLGGGTGHYNLLRGLVELNNPEMITAIPGTWDSGGSSGRLRDELGALPPGDTRQCMVALMEDPGQIKVAQRLFDDRFTEVGGPLQGHSLGNLIITRLDHIYHGQDRALEALRDLFRIRGHVVPISLTHLDLIAKTKRGLEIESEKNIDLRRKSGNFDPSDPIKRIYFNTIAEANPKALQVIGEADKIVFSSGDLFTSVLPHLLVNGIKEAILDSPAKVFFVMNLMTKKGETDFFKASDHLEPFIYYLGDMNRLDYLVVNDNNLSKEVLEIYRSEGQEPVEIDEASCKKLAPGASIIKAQLAKYLPKEHLLRHDSAKIAQIILQTA